MAGKKLKKNDLNLKTNEEIDDAVKVLTSQIKKEKEIKKLTPELYQKLEISNLKREGLLKDKELLKLRTDIKKLEILRYCKEL